ncbi:MAG: AAA family ATPase [Longimicrobiales bacterium]
MRIQSILVENFRAIRRLELKDLPDAVVIAGPNGCGKSSLFDAIRLLKSAYGQYHQNEYQSWYSEFQININKIKQDSARVLHDPTKPLHIRAEFELTSTEQQYLRDNARDLYQEMNWAQFRGMHQLDGEVVVNPTVRRTQGPAIEKQTAALVKALERVIDSRVHVAELRMAPNEDPVVVSAPVVELMFSVYKPDQLGVIDYHSPNRHYGREQVGSINLQIEDRAQKLGQHALYNTQNKYAGVKAEMAQSYVRQLLAEKAGVTIDSSTDLKVTLDELFAVFFPGKDFLGARPTPTGGLEFPVRLETGREHDINELSSGEKEVLLGYLRLRNSAPKNSTILLDEPELHLNPRLIRGLPRFYQKHLGESLGNQLWLITHSDALLREAVHEPAYAVYHMQPAHTMESGANQVDPVSASAEVEAAIIDLVGDLATYSPRSKVVLLEGEESEFDANLIRELFPEFAERVTLVSVGSKRRVGAIHDLLEKASRGGRLDARFYSIVDRDTEDAAAVRSGHRFSWDVYHIENYLLEPRFIREAMRSLQIGATLPSELEVENSLRSCARETIDDLVRVRLDRHVDRVVRSCITKRSRPSAPFAQGFREAAVNSLERFTQLLASDLAIESLQSQEADIRAMLEQALQDDTWKVQFKGRDVLRRFTAAHNRTLGISYEKLRNLIANRMREAAHRPTGMQGIITAILK